MTWKKTSINNDFKYIVEKSENEKTGENVRKLLQEHNKLLVVLEKNQFNIVKEQFILTFNKWNIYYLNHNNYNFILKNL